MQLHDEDLRLIEQYVLGKLDGQSRKNVEARAAKDPEFRELLELETDLKGLALHREALALKALLQAQKPPASVGKQRFMLPVSIAASVSLLLAALGLFWWSAKPKPAHELFEAYYQAYPNTEQPITRGAPTTPNNPYWLYEQGAYEQALEGFAIQDSEAAQFYAAQSYLALGQAEDALLRFQDVLSRQGKYAEAAAWYLALSALATENRALAQLTLIEVRDSDSFYAAKADALLQDIGN